MAKSHNEKRKIHKYTTFFYFQITLLHVPLCHVSVQYSQGTTNEFQKRINIFQKEEKL